MAFRRRNRLFLPIATVAMSLLAFPAIAAEAPDPLSDPDGQPADMSKPVQVYILLGQSNMLGFGKIGAAGKPGSLTRAVREKGKYPYLVDDAGNWTVRKDVRNVRVMGSGTGSMRGFNNEWMTITGGNIGPEMGIGHYVGHVTDAPVLILKSCIGNRSLGWDLLPPGSERFEQDGMIYAGYKDSPDKWKKGETPKPIGWYAGMQYDGDIANAKRVLAELDKYYPGAKGYEIAGFFWWQGDKDRYNPVHASRYEQNLVHLIKTLRKDFDAPSAKFVCATLGQTAKGATGADGRILEAQLAVDGKNNKYPEFKGNVASVYSKPLCHGGASNGHYGGNAETYMDIGEAMGRAMVELLQQDAAGGEDATGASSSTLTPAPVEELPRYKVHSFKRSGNRVTAKVLVEATPDKVPSDAELAGISQALAEKTKYRLSILVYVWKMDYDSPAWATATTSDDGEPRVRRFDNRLPPWYKSAVETPD